MSGYKAAAWPDAARPSLRLKHYRGAVSTCRAMVTLCHNCSSGNRSNPGGGLIGASPAAVQVHGQ